jgi:hypothetical protein
VLKLYAVPTMICPCLYFLRSTSCTPRLMRQLRPRRRALWRRQHRGHRRPPHGSGSSQQRGQLGCVRGRESAASGPVGRPCQLRLQGQASCSRHGPLLSLLPPIHPNRRNLSPVTWRRRGRPSRQTSRNGPAGRWRRYRQRRRCAQRRLTPRCTLSESWGVQQRVGPGKHA